MVCSTELKFCLLQLEIRSLQIRKALLNLRGLGHSQVRGSHLLQNVVGRLVRG